MFAIIYEFDVKMENAVAFTEIWHILTTRIKALCDSQGSRLHKLNDSSWIAYALWPSRDAWETSDLNQPEMVELRQQLFDICDDIRIAYQMDVVDDLISSYRLH
jgi:hypothetical protein